VQELSANATFYTLQITPAPTSEGSIATPVLVQIVIPRQSKVGAGSTSYYKFSLPLAGPMFISLAQVQSDLSWALYAVPTFSGAPLSTCNQSVGVVDESCATVPLANGATYYLAVSESFGWGSPFTLTIVPAP
jgi:hypothetical protein